MQKKFQEPKNMPAPLPELHPDSLLEYPAAEDIYTRAYEDKSVDPDDLPGIVGKAKSNTMNMEDSAGSGLDVPGAELDDDMEAIGEEDEENNYYSLGGESHESLDEDHPE